MDLSVTLDDGTTLPLADLDWALLKPCGCAEAICLAVIDDEEVLPTAQMAFAELEPVKRKRESMIANGYTVKLVRGPEASRLFSTKCEHESVFRAVVTSTRDDGTTWTNTYGPYASRNTAKGVATLKNRHGYHWDTPVKREIKIQRATITWEDLP
jgi:hypothetical protein